MNSNSPNNSAIYSPIRNKRSIWNGRFIYNLKFYTRRFIHSSVGQVILLTAAYIASYNVIVKCIKGTDHPINRYRWRQMEARGELSEELLEKRDKVRAYTESSMKVDFPIFRK